jgi:hypothetical protein
MWLEAKSGVGFTAAVDSFAEGFCAAPPHRRWSSKQKNQQGWHRQLQKNNDWGDFSLSAAAAFGIIKAES